LKRARRARPLKSPPATSRQVKSRRLLALALQARKWCWRSGARPRIEPGSWRGREREREQEGRGDQGAAGEERRETGWRETTDDRRQTIDDRRQTIDDRRQTTSDRRQTIRDGIAGSEEAGRSLQILVRRKTPQKNSISLLKTLRCRPPGPLVRVAGSLLDERCVRSSEAGISISRAPHARP
jgi:hypothetical protein